MTSLHAAIRGEVNAEIAVNIVSGLCGCSDLIVQQAMYYPYFKFDCHCSLPTLFGRRQSEITCLVDAVSGKGATADAFEVDEWHLPPTELVNTSISHIEAQKLAQRTVTHTLGRKLRVIADFRLRLNAAGLIYKRFWIVGNAEVRALVDSVNGSMHPLPSNDKYEPIEKAHLYG